ncbi:outer membrane protein [Methylocapsa palsarum]|uniref:Outer membrane immunogenic protein n=1 Tax=Methylocapsa palsarum TaxID=1612308 RepID=A0A1I4B0F0_9HYPH|nr:outer membrane beta-barrel protein [Methylocapsa palsarum]SFK62308.1 outer membrane immunogenic protein [Methylocapsa palsarum]
MLRLALLQSVGAVALCGMCLAADLAPAAPTPSPYNWTGAYGGVNLGGHWRNSSMQFTGTDSSGLEAGGGLGVAQSFGVIPYNGVSTVSGLIGGGQLGYNYQFNSFVFGLEADVDGATGRNYSSASLSNSVFIFPTLTQSDQRLDWLGTVLGRLGWTPAERLLLYVTGGLAFGQSTSSFTLTNGFADPALSAYAQSKRNVGWAVGGGFEFALPDAWSNWSVKVEYLYYDLGSSTGTVGYQNIDLNEAEEFSSLSGKVRNNGNIVRAGLNYKFNLGELAPALAPVVGKY